MSKISPTSLFHFTEKKEVLKSILQNGLRFSYSKEEFPGCLRPINPEVEFDGIARHMEKMYVAIPMICFCDIPLSRVSEHVGKYGKYGVAFDKTKMAKDYNFKGFYELNPISYYYSDSLVSPLHGLCASISSLNPSDEDRNNLLRLLGFSKSYDNHHEYAFFKKQYHCFYDEREWRLVRSNANGCSNSWLFSYEVDDFDDALERKNDELHSTDSAYLGVWRRDKQALGECLYNFITHIIVERECEIPEFAEYIMDSRNRIMGVDTLIQSDRALLCSRLTSLERINNDF